IGSQRLPLDPHPHRRVVRWRLDDDPTDGAGNHERHGTEQQQAVAKERLEQPKHRRQCRTSTCDRGMGTGEDGLYLSRLAEGCRPGRTGRAWDRCRVGPFHAGAGLTKVGSGVVAPAEPMARTPPTHTSLLAGRRKKTRLLLSSALVALLAAGSSTAWVLV